MANSKEIQEWLKLNAPVLFVEKTIITLRHPGQDELQCIVKGIDNVSLYYHSVIRVHNQELLSSKNTQLRQLYSDIIAINHIPVEIVKNNGISKSIIGHRVYEKLVYFE